MGEYLAGLGYDNYCKVLNAKDYGVPQNRERIFILSIMDNDRAYHFPDPIPLEKRLRDVLEDKVAEKYYLSDEMVEGFLKQNKDLETKIKDETEGGTD